MFHSNVRFVFKYSEAKSSLWHPVMRQVQLKIIISDTNIFQPWKVYAQWGGPRRPEVGGGGSILEEIRGGVHAPPAPGGTVLGVLLPQKRPLQVRHLGFSARSW